MTAFAPSIVVTDWFLDHLPTLSWDPTTTEIGAIFFTRTPLLSEDTSFASLVPRTDLDVLPYWVPCDSPATFTLDGAAVTPKATTTSTVDWTAVQIVDDASTPLLLGDGYGWTFSPADPNDVVQEILVAVAFYLVGTYDSAVDPLLFVTDQGIDSAVFHIDARYGQGAEGWIVAVDNDTGLVAMPGATLLVLPEPEWESAHAHHLWLEPQRTNFIVNPSFEASTVGWVTGWKAESLVPGVAWKIRTGYNTLLGGDAASVVAPVTSGTVTDNLLVSDVAWKSPMAFLRTCTDEILGHFSDASLSVPYDNQEVYASLVVPAGVTSLTVECWGARGGGTSGFRGFGSYIKGEVTVTPGETLRIYTGVNGDDTGASGAKTSRGGGAGGFSGTHHGGGASEVRRSPYGVFDRLIVGGGGGGSSNGIGANTAGGGSGYPTGTAGAANGGGAGGGAGTQTAGGVVGASDGSPGTSGGFGTGGDGATQSIYGGGGGGGGYWGGGGGGVNSQRGGAGGGGSSGVPGGVLITFTNALWNAGGKVEVTAGHGSDIAMRTYLKRTNLPITDTLLGSDTASKVFNRVRSTSDSLLSTDSAVKRIPVQFKQATDTLLGTDDAVGVYTPI